MRCNFIFQQNEILTYGKTIPPNINYTVIKTEP